MLTSLFLRYISAINAKYQISNKKSKRVKRQSLVNKLRRSRYKLAIKKINKLIEKKDIKEINKFFPTFQSELMKIAKTGVVKKRMHQGK